VTIRKAYMSFSRLAATMDIFDPNETTETDRTTEADRKDLRNFVWMAVMTVALAIAVLLGLCNLSSA
jgi:hypothetical protein